MSKNLGRTAGLLEANVAPGSGLARRNFRLHLISAQTANVLTQPIGGAASAAVTVFTNLALSNRNNPYCGTLVAQIVQGSVTTGTIRLRIKGYDQFHEPVEELTPVIALVAKTNNFIYLAQTFSYIDKIEFVSTGLDIASDTIAIGQRWDWTRTIDATNHHHAGRNLGFALPLRSGRVPGAQRTGPNRFTQTMGPNLVGTLADDSRSVAPERQARATLTLTGTPSDNDTVTLDGVVYTWKTAITAAAGDVLIGANASEALDNLAAAIIKAGALGGVKYADATVAHPTVTAGPRGVAGADQFLRILAREPGTFGTTIVVAEGSGVATITAMLIGLDMPLEIFGLTIQDVTGAALAGAIVHLPPTAFAVGLAEAGWSAPVEKVHIYAQASVAQWAATDNILVTLQMVSAESAT